MWDSVMYYRLSAALLLVLLFLSPLVAQAQTPELDKLFSTAISNLQSSESKIDSLQASLASSKSSIASLETLSETQKQTLLAQQQTLEEQSSSLRSINSELTNISKQLTVSKDKLAMTQKVAVILAIILLIRVCAMVAGYIIYAKGIKLPRWVDILL